MPKFIVYAAYKTATGTAVSKTSPLTKVRATAAANKWHGAGALKVIVEEVGKPSPRLKEELAILAQYEKPPFDDEIPF